MNDDGAVADGSGGGGRRAWKLSNGSAASLDDRTSSRHHQPGSGERERSYGGDEREASPGPRLPEPSSHSSNGGHRDGPDDTDLSGRLVGDRYQLIERLGQGGMGTVWRAHDGVIARDVAVKEPRLPAHIPHEERVLMFARLEREARAAAQIDHPSVVGIHDVVTVNGQPWVVMELVRGQSLADVLAEGTLAPEEAARIALPIAGVLAAAHAQRVLHRDVKPSNVMLGPSGRIVLTDFGIAHIEGETSLTQTGAMIGSPEYTAPERVLGQIPGPPADFFSLGVLLYTALEGFSPFRRQQTQATFQAVLHAEPQQPLRAGALADLVLRLLSKEPQDRPTGGEITTVLERAANPRPPLSLPGSQDATTDNAPDSAPDNDDRSRGWASGGEANRTQPADGSPGRRRLREAVRRGVSRGGPLTHPAVSTLTASLVTGAIVSATMWPEGDAEDGASDAPGDKKQTPAASSEVPKGWEKHKQIGASIALPADYAVEPRPYANTGPGKDTGPGADETQHVGFRQNKDQFDGQLIILRGEGLPEPKTPTGERAAYWHERYTTNDDFAEQLATLSDTEVNGQKSKVLTLTYDPGNGELWRKKELFYNHKGEMWRILVDRKVDSVEDSSSDQFFEKAISTFQPDGGRTGDSQKN